MTTYHISVGYCANCGLDAGHKWVALKLAAREVADDPQAIVAEARRLGAPETCGEGCCKLDDYAEPYLMQFSVRGEPMNGCPIEIVDEQGSDGERRREIVQWAGTADDIKFHVRRAFLRLLIEVCHRMDIELNVHVA